MHMKLSRLTCFVQVNMTVGDQAYVMVLLQVGTYVVSHTWYLFEIYLIMRSEILTIFQFPLMICFVFR